MYFSAIIYYDTFGTKRTGLKICSLYFCLILGNYIDVKESNYLLEIQKFACFER